MAEKVHPLGPSFKYMKDINDGNVPVGSFFNMVGAVKDFKAPMKTSRDWMSTLSISDETLTDYDMAVQFVLFRPKEEDHPHDVQDGDIAVILHAKSQTYGVPSALSHFNTRFFLYSRDGIPNTLEFAAGLPRAICKGSDVGQLTDKIHKYVAWLHQTMLDKDGPLDDATFEQKTQWSLNVKDKFSILEDVRHGNFYDLVVKLVKAPYNQGDRMTLWVSDFSQNEKFFPRMADNYSTYGDPFGYADGMMDSADDGSKFQGAVGRRSMQITCYDEHIDFIEREGLQSGQWVHLKNIQVKFGRNGANLEGFLRSDRGNVSKKYQVVPVDPYNPDDSGCADKLNACLLRMNAYLKAEKKEEKRRKMELARSNESEPGNAVTSTADNPPDADGNDVHGKKRTMEEGDAGPLNSKRRRELKREAQAAKHRLEEAKKEQELHLNHMVRCEHPDQPTTPIPTILSPELKSYITTIDGKKEVIQLPFNNHKYRTVARVVAFHPKDISRFSVSRKITELDTISDDDDSDFDSSDSSSESSEDGSLPKNRQQKLNLSGGMNSTRVWEWNFALRLEDATLPKEKDKGKETEKRQRMWVEVGNPEGELLLNMDAVDLRKSPSALAKLQETLTTLWGNLPAVLQPKVDPQAKAEARAKSSHAKKTKNTTLNNKPPANSGDEVGSDNNDDEPGEEAQQGQEAPEAKLENHPFYCCIREHGIKTSKPDPQKANMRRVLTLFGVKVVSG